MTTRKECLICGSIVETTLAGNRCPNCGIIPGGAIKEVPKAIVLGLLLLFVASCGPAPSREAEQAKLDTLHMYLSDIQESVREMNVHMTKLCQEIAVTRGYTPIGAEHYCSGGEE